MNSVMPYFRISRKPTVKAQKGASGFNRVAGRSTYKTTVRLVSSSVFPLFVMYDPEPEEVKLPPTRRVPDLGSGRLHARLFWRRQGQSGRATIAG